MNRSNLSTRLAQATLVTCAIAALGGCSRPTNNTAAAIPASSAATVAMNTQPPQATTYPSPVVAPVAPAPTHDAYEQGRRDQERSDARHQRHERDDRDGRSLAPRSDRDADVAQSSRDDSWRGQQQVAAARCADCGVIESVDAVQVQGPNNGVGAVAGGLGGALVGNRIAGTHNRALGGVIGAVGGGLIGNAIEKHERVNTVYDVHVRMEDGSVRTVRQASAPVVGAKVRVDQDGLHERA